MEKALSLITSEINMKLKEYLDNSLGEGDRIFTLNIEITGLCNSHCGYCHFYLKHDRESVAYHMPDEQFSSYCRFVKYWANESGGETNYRFSGGDPITLKDKLFNRADLAYATTGMRPFVLTHGHRLKDDWFSKAKNSAIEAIYFSVENPINPDKGAEDPENTIKYIEKHNSSELPIKLGVCIVPNEQFGNLLEICDWFFDRVGYIPPIAEMNYGAYKSPTQQQWKDLEKSLGDVLDKYFGKTHLNLFHSVSPELAYDGIDPIIFSLGIINKFGINEGNIEQKALELAGNISSTNYPYLTCRANCPWSKFCRNTKWYWQGDDNNDAKVKVKDYCRFKRIINDSYYKAIVDSAHKTTDCSIEI